MAPNTSRKLTNELLRWRKTSNTPKCTCCKTTVGILEVMKGPQRKVCVKRTEACLQRFLSCRWCAATPQDQHCLRFTATTSLARGGRFQCKLVGLKQGMTIHDTCVFGFWQVLEQLAETSVTWKPSRGFSSFSSCETKVFLMHTPCVPIQDNGFGEWPVMSKFRIARITSAQGGGTSRRNARQSDPNIIPLAYHSPLCWHGLPKHRFRGRNAMESFLQGNALMPWQGTTCAQRHQPMQKNSSPMWTGATPSVIL